MSQRGHKDWRLNQRYFSHTCVQMGKKNSNSSPELSEIETQVVPQLPSGGGNGLNLNAAVVKMAEKPARILYNPTFKVFSI